jgi:hypothetical protein
MKKRMYIVLAVLALLVLALYGVLTGTGKS